MRVLKEDFIYPSQIGITFVPRIDEGLFTDYLRKYFEKSIGEYVRDNIEMRDADEYTEEESFSVDFVIIYVGREQEAAREFTFHVEITYPDKIITSLYEDGSILIGEQIGSLKDLDLRIKTAAESVKNTLLVNGD